MQEPGRTVADATEWEGVLPAVLDNELRRAGTIVRNARSAKEWKNPEFSGGLPSEIRQKIANCMK